MLQRSAFALTIILILGTTVAFTVYKPGGGTEMVKTELYFGRSSVNGPVTDAQWNAFLANEVTPVFPDGFSVLDANGQWKDTQTGEIIRENSNMLMVVYDANTLEKGSIHKIIESYKKQFSQQSVMRLDSKVLVTF